MKSIKVNLILYTKVALNSSNTSVTDPNAKIALRRHQNMDKIVERSQTIAVRRPWLPEARAVRACLGAYSIFLFARQIGSDCIVCERGGAATGNWYLPPCDIRIYVIEMDKVTVLPVHVRVIVKNKTVPFG